MLIFLDIDGVMVQASPWKPVDNLPDGFYKFSPTAVSHLQEIISGTNASIVLTTSHKNRFTSRQWKSILLKRGIIVNSVGKLPTRKKFLNRKEEIITWRKRHRDLIDFVIIDDDKSLNGLPEELKKKLVLTNSAVGLTRLDAAHAIEILKG